MSTEKEIKNEAAVAASAEQTANAEVQTPKKRRGRGINNDLRDVTRKKFDERTDCNKANGLFIGHLEDVKVDWATLKDDVQGMPSFAGLAGRNSRLRLKSALPHGEKCARTMKSYVGMKVILMWDNILL